MSTTHDIIITEETTLGEIREHLRLHPHLRARFVLRPTEKRNHRAR